MEMIIGLLSQSDNFRGLMERGNVSLVESCVLEERRREMVYRVGARRSEPSVVGDEGTLR